MTTAIVLTTDESDGQPAALLAFRGRTLFSHLLGQLSSLGIDRTHVVAHPHHAEALRQVEGIEGTEVVECVGIADELRCVRGLARTSTGPLVVLRGDLAAHREALAELLADPGTATGALVTGDLSADGPPVRVEHQRLVSAGSPYHHVSAANAVFLGVLRVAPHDAEALAEAADGLAALAEKECVPDVPALLLVGLVRVSAHVAASDVRVLRCRRVRDQAGAADADAALREVDEDRVLLDASVKADDGFFTTHFVSPYSKYVARWAARRGLTPNTVTAASFVIGVGAALSFALGGRAWLVVGAVLVQVAFLADCVDGQLARYTRRFSAVGAWLDATFDRAKEYLLYAGLAIGAAGVWRLALAAFVLQTVRHMVDFAYGDAHPQTVAAPPRRPLDVPGDGLEEHVAAGAPSSAPLPLPRRMGLVALALSRRFEGSAALRWAKKIVVLPIGERFALISVAAAVGGARATFLALLAWGSVAALYTFSGRVLRSLAR